VVTTQGTYTSMSRMGNTQGPQRRNHKENKDSIIRATLPISGDSVPYAFYPKLPCYKK